MVVKEHQSESAESVESAAAVVLLLFAITRRKDLGLKEYPVGTARAEALHKCSKVVCGKAVNLHAP